MSSIEYRLDQWSKIYKFLLVDPHVYVGKESNCRLFMEAILWIVRSGAQWRLLPKEYGLWNSVYKRFSRWEEQGVWERMFTHFSKDTDLENVSIDGSVIRAHPCSAGAQKKEEQEISEAQTEQALGRSKGGFTTKIHAAVDALGNPIRLSLTPGQSHDILQARPLIEGLEAQAVLADKAYDADQFLNFLREKGILIVIPQKKNRIEKRDYDFFRYRERHLIECFFNKIKHFRRVFSRFDKIAKKYLAFLQFVSTLIWLR